MIYKKIIITVALSFVFVSISAMKRHGENIDNPFETIKRKKEATLFTAMKDRDFPTFQNLVHAGSDINKTFHEEPLFFNVLKDIDMHNDKKIELFLDKTKADEALVKKNDATLEVLYGCMKLIVEHNNFNPHCISENGSSALHFLAERKVDSAYTEKTRQLVKLHDEDFILRNVLKAGAKVSEQDHNGFSPLHTIAMGHYVSEDIGSNDEDIEFNVLAGKEDLRFIEALIEYGANPNAVDSEGRTPLHFCSNNVTKVPLLLALGARYDKKDNDGNVPFDYSTNPIIQDYILKNEATVEQHKDNIRKIVLHNSSNNTKSNYLPHRVAAREIGKVSLRPGLKDSYPYTEAILQLTDHFSEKDIMYEMGYELQMIE